MANQYPDAHRQGPTRMITKRWKEANTVDYGGGGWGDEDDEEQPAQQVHDGQNQGWGHQQQQPTVAAPYYASNRTAANPSPMRSTGRPSFDQGPGRPSFDQSRGRPPFDQGDERRTYSLNQGSFEGPYPTAQPNPFPEPRHDFASHDADSQFRGYRAEPPLHVQTAARPPSRDRGPYSAAPAPYGQDRRMNQYSEPWQAPHSAGAVPSGQRSQSNSRQPIGEMFPRHEGPARPSSRGSQGTSPARFTALPPRKSSLSQQNPPPDMAAFAPVESEQSPSQSARQGPDAKPLPFLRPIDIWKRHEEEMSERQSQGSSRPSIDSSTGRDQAGSTLPKESPTSKQSLDALSATEKAEPSPSKMVLGPVEGKKSEYGVESRLQDDHQSPPSANVQVTSPTPRDSEPQSATSEYSNRLDLASTNASIYSSPSVKEQRHGVKDLAQHSLPPVRTTSGFGDDFFDRQRSVNLGPVAPGATSMQGEEEPSVPERGTPAPPAKDALLMAGAQSGLHHSNSHGYRSLVEQAFDESQREPQTPISASNTVTRTNSAGTSDISPINTRDMIATSGPESLAERVNQNTIQEEPLAEATSTSAGPAEAASEHRPPVPIKPGYRRDQTPPSRENSPARRPLSVTSKDLPGPASAALSAGSPVVPNATGDMHSTSSRPSVPKVSAEPGPIDQPEGSRPSQVIPPRDESAQNMKSTSDEYREWQAQRRQFNAKMGIQDSPSVEISSPVSRAESPNKGTVREIAGKLENRSGRSSPLSPETSRPAIAHLESFRPVLPGGWQSYTTNASTPREEVPNNSTIQPTRPEFSTRTETTESQIPRAVAPRGDDPSRKAFVAAAAAGTALAGSFGVNNSSGGKGSSWLGRFRDESSDTSEDESYASASHHEPGLREATETVPESPTTPRAIPPLSPAPPAPLPKDTPQEANAPQDSAGYFPAPLRTSRSGEPRTPAFPAQQESETSPNVEDNDRLQQEIVKSLTPSSSPYVPPAQLLPTKDAGSRSLRADGHFDPVGTESNANKYSRPGMLDQRFSWETETPSKNGTSSTAVPNNSISGTLNKNSPIDKGSSDTVEYPGRPDSRVSSEISRPGTATGLTDSLAPRTVPFANPLSGAGPTTHPSATGSENELSSNVGGPMSNIATSGSKPNMTNSSYPPSSPSSATKEIPLRTIMGMEQPEERMRAYASNHHHFSTSDSGLEQWLQAMGRNSPASAAILARNGALTPQQSESLQNYKPSPSKGVLGRLTSDNFSKSGSPNSGTKQVQKYGAKAGFAAKGLLAKGKEKLRTASAGDKANKRRSSGPMIIPDQTRQHSSSITSSSAPPQIPEQNLNISPVDDESWSMPYVDRQGTGNVPSSSAPTNTSPAKARELSPNLNVAGPTNLVQPSHTPSTDISHGHDSSTSPRVSGLGDQRDDQASSRSIGEVTRSRDDQSTIGKVSQDTPDQTKNSTNDHHGTGVAAAAVVPAAMVMHHHSEDSRRPDDSRTQEVETSNAPATINTIDATPVETPEADRRAYEANSDLDPLQKEALGVPGNKRHSNVSDVSSPSQGPDLSEEANRSISPAIMTNTQQHADVEDVPEYSTLPSKEAEAAAERNQAQALEQQQEGLPSYQNEDAATSGPASNHHQGPSRIGPGAAIIPVTDLSAKRREEARPTQPRPFSFAAANSLEPETRNQILRTISPPDQQNLDKQYSNVSVEEVPGEPRSSSDRMSKSYSRPFGNGPDAQDQIHPALRSHPPGPVDRAQMYSSESPLPSARRPQEEIDRYRQNQGPSPVPPQHQQQQQQQQQRPDEQYRIPGPYGQEYRSPKQPPQNPAQRQYPTEQQQQPFSGQASTPKQQTQQYEQQQSPPYQQGPMGSQQQAPMGPPQEKPRQRMLGGLFRTRSGSRSRRDNADNTGERRNSLFKPRSRQDSIRSNSSRPSHRDSESRDQVPGLPGAGMGPTSEMINGNAGKGRRSKDILRSSTFGSTAEEEKRKKKRHSGFGSLFSRGPKSAPVQRSSTALGHNEEPDKLGQLQKEMFDHQVASGRSPGRMNQEPSRSESQQSYHGAVTSPGRMSPEQFRSTQPPGGAYYSSQGQGQGQQQWPEDVKRADGQYPNSAAAYGESSNRQLTPPVNQQNISPNQGQYRYARDDPTSPSYHAGGLPFSQRDEQQDQRPGNLRIDTGQSHGRSPDYGFPATAPAGPGPRGYESDQQQPYGSTRDHPAPASASGYGRGTSPQPPYTSTHAPVNSGRTQSHAIDLHKRSRSPRNGRKASNEDIATVQRLDPNPASQLGTFKNRSPVGRVSGDGGSGEVQEKPWSIQLPEDEEERERVKRRSRQALIERSGAPQTQTRADRPLTVAEKMMGNQQQQRAPLSPSRSNVNSRKEFLAELPGSKAEGYESEEEIPMSATAYPGQEWMPMGAAEMGYGRWDD